MRGDDVISISINILKYYGRFYSATDSENEYPWWFCLSDESVFSQKDLKEKFGYQSPEEALSSRIFIPLFKTDMSKLEEEFLLDFNLKHILKNLKNTPDFDISFRKYIDQNCLFQDWFQFEGHRLRADAINWCHQYGIRYVEDERDYKPANI